MTNTNTPDINLAFQHKRNIQIRIGMTPIVLIVGLVSSISYVHGCGAGIKPLETIVTIITPLISTCLLWKITKTYKSIIFSLLFSVSIYLLSFPYLDWVHGNESSFKNHRSSPVRTEKQGTSFNKAIERIGEPQNVK